VTKSGRLASIVLAVASVAILTCVAPGVASAALIPVTSSADNTTDDQTCTLREATIAATTNLAVNPTGGNDCPAGQAATQDTISIGDLDGAGADTITLSSGFDLELSASNGGVLVDGRGPALTTIDANDTSRVFQIDSPGAVTIRDLTATDGDPVNGPGGGIISPFADLTLVNVVVSNNTVNGATAANLNGAGIHVSQGSLSMSDSTVSGNVIDATAGGETLFRGAGIFLGSTAGASITRSTISANTINGSASDVQILRGGGIATADSQDPVFISHSTIDNNTLVGANSTLEGGGIAWVGDTASDELLISNSTFGDNIAEKGGALFTQGGIASVAFTTFGPSEGSEGAGLHFDDCCGGSAQLRGTLFDTGTASDCADGAPTSLGHNVEKGTDGTADDDCNLGQASDALTTQQLLAGALANNGGPTRTYELSGSASAAIDIAPSPSCLDADGTGLTLDQRGFPRPFELDGDGTPECDAGSYERVACNGLPATGFGTELGETLNGTSGTDVLVGLGGADTINPVAGADAVCGNDGNDTLQGQADANASDFYAGDAGSDTFQLFNFLDPGTIDLASGTAGGAGLGAETLQSIENATGGLDNDILIGDGGPNVLDGLFSEDTITGGGGSDTLLGNTGNDALFARDGVADIVDCGIGTADTAQTDQPSLDTVTGCESVDALAEPPAPPPPASVPAVTGQRAAALKKCKKKKTKAKRRKCRKRALKLPL
jgi:RTX calcium-binding nonapeptide repeat (4 copies)